MHKVTHRPEPVERSIDLDGVTIAYADWPGDSSLPTLLLVHATGFHRRVWDQTIARLDPRQRVIAVDQRGHGLSSNEPPFDWLSFGGDLIAFVHELDLHGAVAAGHSMGGHCVVQAAAAAPDAFASLLLIDPVIMAPSFYDMPMALTDPAEHPTSRRKADFDSWQAMRDRFADRAPFKYWMAEVLDDYCRYGTVPRPEGEGVTLACPPIVEASVYTGSNGRNIYPLLPKVTCPVTVLRARQRVGAREDAMDFSASPTWEGLAERFTNARDIYRPDLSHFIPMEDPELVAGLVREMSTSP